MELEKPAICLKGVSKKYHIYDTPFQRLKGLLPWNRGKSFGREHIALHEIDLEIKRGEVVGIVGRNGAGKSTLLQIICGTLTPSSGEVVVNGRVAALLELGSGFNPEFSGRENVYLAAAIAGMDRAEIEAKYDDIVAFSEIGEYIEQPVKSYSSGMMVRLAFSVATSVDPDILIIDEALSVGDGAFARKSFDRIMGLKEKGVTILFCSHSLFQVESLCNRAIWIERGRLKMQGAPSEVIPEYELSLEQPCSDDRSLVYTKRGANRIVSVKSNLTELRSGVDDLIIDVEYIYDRELDAPCLVYEIFTIGGQTVTSGVSKNDNFVMQKGGSGTKRVRITFPKIKLMRGKYRIDLYLMCERCIHLYDHAMSCLKIDVKQEKNEKGVVFLEHYWSNISEG